MQRILLILIMPFIFMVGCKFQKGDIYSSNQADSLQYVIAAKGSGEKLTRKASKMKFQHEIKGNSCQIKYISDSATLSEQKGILLINASLPDIEDDMLSKGYFGTFTSKQSVTYLLISFSDFPRLYTKIK